MNIKIKDGLEIGDGCEPFIIAEVGSNWHSFDECIYSIDCAKASGASAVKFQLFTNEALYGCGGGTPYELPVEWLPKLKERADLKGIEFMCSAFSPELIDAVDPYVNVHKVASAELTHLPMLDKLSRMGKPVILSTGASGSYDIRRAQQALKSCPLVLMYCVAAYPAQEVHLGNIQKLRDTFGTLSGYSDHTLDVACIPKRAIELGACVIEKHFSAVTHQTPDSDHSLSFDQFKRMVDVLRGKHTAELVYAAEESEMIKRHNRRIIATRDIHPGEKLSLGVNYGVFRSLKDETHAFSPWMTYEIHGKPAKREIQAGSGIGPGDV